MTVFTTPKMVTLSNFFINIKHKISHIYKEFHEITRDYVYLLGNVCNEMTVFATSKVITLRKLLINIKYKISYIYQEFCLIVFATPQIVH